MRTSHLTFERYDLEWEARDGNSWLADTTNHACLFSKRRIPIELLTICCIEHRVCLRFWWVSRLRFRETLTSYSSMDTCCLMSLLSLFPHYFIVRLCLKLMNVRVFFLLTTTVKGILLSMNDLIFKRATFVRGCLFLLRDIISFLIIRSVELLERRKGISVFTQQLSTITFPNEKEFLLLSSWSLDLLGHFNDETSLLVFLCGLCVGELHQLKVFMKLRIWHVYLTCGLSPSFHSLCEITDLKRKTDKRRTFYISLPFN